MKHPLITSIIALSTLAPLLPANASEHDLQFGTRLKLSGVEIDQQSGRGISVLLRSSLDSEWSTNISTLLEVDIVRNGLEDEHSDGSRFNDKPIIHDTESEEINQAFIAWKYEQWQVRVGRQRIEWDNQRFIGSVDSWQNDQTFDSLTMRYPLFFQSKIEYAYINNVNLSWGDDATRDLGSAKDILSRDYGWQNERPPTWWGNNKHNSHLIRFDFNEWDYVRWISYYLDIKNKDHKPSSNQTLATALRFNYKKSKTKFRVEFDAARQKRTEVYKTPSTFYYRFKSGVEYRSAEVSINREVFSSKDNASFITPLGSNEDFQGWAEVFFTTPNIGIIDNRLQFDWRFNPWRMDIRYHEFSSYQNQRTLGKEFDIDVLYKPTKKTLIILRYADFDSESEFEDVKRFGLSFSYNL